MITTEKNEKEKRHRRICELIMDGKPLSVDFLSKKFDVSPMTIRRDLEQLEARGELIRTRGGAEPVWYSDTTIYLIRAKENIREGCNSEGSSRTTQ